MATINISDLRPTGSELFSDSESYMNELSDSELETINGGLLPALLWSAGVAVARFYAQRAATQSTYNCAVAIGAILKPRDK
jgi:bacteriocin-like protein